MSALQRSFSDELAAVGLAVTPLAIEVMGTKLVLVATIVTLAASTVVPLFQREVRAFASGDPAAGELVAVPADENR